MRDERIELVDEFTGRVMDDRRWPDGLQAALEAKETLPIRPGRILGSITLQHFLKHYPRLSGIDRHRAARGRRVGSFLRPRRGPRPAEPPLRPRRPARPDLHSQRREAPGPHRRDQARERDRASRSGRHEQCRRIRVAARELDVTGVACRVLNAKNDEAEAEIIAESGAIGAVTISTNMAVARTSVWAGPGKQSESE